MQLGAEQEKKLKGGQIKNIILKKINIKLFYTGKRLEKISLQGPGPLPAPAPPPLHATIAPCTLKKAN
jgi:hypothetical protein